MRRVILSLTTIVLLLLLIFGISSLSAVDFTDQKSLAQAFTQLTGFLSLGMMAIAIVLALRLRWMEPVFGGLDKIYRLHKWLAIGALPMLLAHWLIKTGEGHRPEATVDAAGNVVAAVHSFDPVQLATQTLFPSLYGPARGIAQPILFLLFALMALALIKRVPYRIFRKVHFVMGITFVIFAYHSVILMRPEYWSTPFGWSTIALSVIGSLASIYLLVIHFKGFPSFKAVVASTHYFPELKALEIDLDMQEPWRGHKPGQFVFVETDPKEGPHPFTLATHWSPESGRIGIIAKELGDYTAMIRERFAPGTPVKVDGPYGRFNFECKKPRQVWIGAGIGITPFIAKMRDLAGSPSNKVVDLFHTTREVSEEGLARMQAEADAAGINLHIIISERDGRLNVAKLTAMVPDWKEASFWFCGPSLFAEQLRKGLVAEGLNASNFHQELFEMR
jgi:predicted ferric reductase